MSAYPVSAIARAPLRAVRRLPVRMRRPAFIAARPILADARGATRSTGAPRDFCCAGCLAVAQTIAAAGLEDFYSSRTEERVPQRRCHGRMGTLGRLRGDGRPCARRRPRPLRSVAAARRTDVRRLRVAARDVARAATRRHGGAHQLREPPCVRRVESRTRRGCRPCCVRWRRSAIRAHPYDPARSEKLARTERRALLLRTAVALLSMMQVMMFALPAYLSRRRGPERVAPPRMGVLRADAARARLFRRAVLPRRVARCRASSPWHGCAGRAGDRRGVCCKRVGDIHRRRRRLLRLRHDVHRAAADRALRRTRRAAEGGRGHRTRGAATPGRCRAPRGVAGSARRRRSRQRNLPRGDIVLVRPGAVVPADGEMVDGHSHVEEAMLTGESLPQARGLATPCWPARSTATERWWCAFAPPARRRAWPRCCGWSNARRASVRRWRGWPIAWPRGSSAACCCSPSATAIVWWHIDPARVLPVTVALLVVSCPCALSLATPAALAAATGALARAGVVLARSDALETLARVTHVVLDKTGTLTEGPRRGLCASTPGMARERGARARRCRFRAFGTSAGARAAKRPRSRREAVRRAADHGFPPSDRRGRRGPRGRIARAGRPSGLCRRAVGPDAASLRQFADDARMAARWPRWVTSMAGAHSSPLPTPASGRDAPDRANCDNSASGR